MNEAETYELSDQALGALMMALQKSLLEQSDIIPVLKAFEFVSTTDGLKILNPPVVRIPNENLEEHWRMPTYVYKCVSCSQIISIFHSFSEVVTDCELCGVENSLQKDYSTPFRSGKAKKQSDRPVGEITNDFIEQTREEIKQEKESLKRELFND